MMVGVFRGLKAPAPSVNSKTRESGFVVSHPRRENKSAPRMGHPLFVVSGNREMRYSTRSF
jgi:hypothetical protein